MPILYSDTLPRLCRGLCLADRVKEAEVVAYEDLGSEAIRRLVVEDFPIVVVNDLREGDLYREGRERWRRPVSRGEDTIGTVSGNARGS